MLISEGAEQIPGGDFARIGLMYLAIGVKFRSNLDIAQKLVSTGDERIVGGNDWEDRFWGVDPPGSENGENNLGKIHMKVRAELQAEGFN